MLVGGIFGLPGGAVALSVMSDNSDTKLARCGGNSELAARVSCCAVLLCCADLAAAKARARRLLSCHCREATGMADPNPGWTKAPWSMRLTSSSSSFSASALMPPPPPRPPLSSQPPTASTSAPDSTDGLDLTAVSWTDYFAVKLSVPARGGVFRVYLSERHDAGPLVVCLHGAGYTGLSWALVAAELRGCCTVAAVVRGKRLLGRAALTAPPPSHLCFSSLARRPGR